MKLVNYGSGEAKLRNEARKSYDNVYKHSLEHYLALDKELSTFCKSVTLHIKKKYFGVHVTSNH